MKIISFILSLYIFSLVTAPVLDALDLLPVSMYCQDFCTTEEEQDDYGCDELYNPFLSCNCGYGFIVPHINNSLTTFSPFKAKNSEYAQSVPIQYIHSIWHPPKA